MPIFNVTLTNINRQLYTKETLLANSKAIYNALMPTENGNQGLIQQMDDLAERGKITEGTMKISETHTSKIKQKKKNQNFELFSAMMIKKIPLS